MRVDRLMSGIRNPQDLFRHPLPFHQQYSHHLPNPSTSDPSAPSPSAPPSSPSEYAPLPYTAPLPPQPSSPSAPPQTPHPLQQRYRQTRSSHPSQTQTCAYPPSHPRHSPP